MKRKIVPVFVLTALFLLQTMTPALAEDDAELTQVGDILVLSEKTEVETAVEEPAVETAGEPVAEEPAAEESTEENPGSDENPAETDTDAEQSTNEEPADVPADEESALTSSSEELPAEEEAVMLLNMDGTGTIDGNWLTDSYSLTVNWTMPELSLGGYAWNAEEMQYELQPATGTTTGNAVIAFTNNNSNDGISWDYTITKLDGSLTEGQTLAHAADYTDNAVSGTIRDASYTFTDRLTFTTESPLTEDVTLCTYTVTVTGVGYTFDTATDSITLKSSELLSSDTVSYIDSDGKSVTAYNGFISKTAGCAGDDAINFVMLLNGTEVKPGGSTSGHWRLLASQSDTQLWYSASGNPTAFGNVQSLWTYESDTASSRNLDGDSGSNAETGFVVIWVPD